MYSKRLVAILIISIPSISWAGWPCSIDHGYPEVSDIAVTEQGVVLLLGSYFYNYQQSDREPIQLISTGDGWQRLEKLVAMPAPTRVADCPVKPKIPTEQELAEWYWRGMPKAPNSYFEQELVGCVEFGDETWSGTSWYGGEGSWGVGGIIGFNALTQRTDGRYLWGLHGYSVSHLELFDEQLWIGTTYRGECGGPASGFGIKRYPLVRGKPFPYEVVDPKYTIPPRGTQAWDEPRICGFAARDMLIVDGDLWIATELGLSVVRLKDGELVFDNYVPDLTSDSLMRKVSCDDLYTELLESPRSITDEGFDIGVMFDQFWARLSKHRGEFTRRHLRRLHGHDDTVESIE
jgi:hypothetical protein